MGRRLKHEARAATLKTGTLVAALAAVAAAVGYLLMGLGGLVVGVVGVALLIATSASVPVSWVMRMLRARPVSEWEAPTLHAIVARLATRAGIGTPAVWIIRSPEPNAVATDAADGPGALAVTTGALDILTTAELEAVLGHEIAHLKHGDTTLLRITGTLAQAVVTLLRVSIWVGLLLTFIDPAYLPRLALLVLLFFTVPMALGLLQNALSRTREHLADATAAALTGRPLALASALSKISATTSSWLQLLFGRRREPAWLSSHPPTPERVRRLEALAGRAQAPLRPMPRQRRTVRRSTRIPILIRRAG